jgi:hypothetical protein
MQPARQRVPNQKGDLLVSRARRHWQRTQPARIRSSDLVRLHCGIECNGPPTEHRGDSPTRPRMYAPPCWQLIAGFRNGRMSSQPGVSLVDLRFSSAQASLAPAICMRLTTQGADDGVFRARIYAGISQVAPIIRTPRNPITISDFFDMCLLMPNDQHQRWEPAANVVGTVTERDGWLPSAACCGLGCLLLTVTEKESRSRLGSQQPRRG